MRKQAVHSEQDSCLLSKCNLEGFSVGLYTVLCTCVNSLDSLEVLLFSEHRMWQSQKVPLIILQECETRSHPLSVSEVDYFGAYWFCHPRGGVAVVSVLPHRIVLASSGH